MKPLYAGMTFILVGAGFLYAIYYVDQPAVHPPAIAPTPKVSQLPSSPPAPQPAPAPIVVAPLPSAPQLTPPAPAGPPIAAQQKVSQKKVAAISNKPKRPVPLTSGATAAATGDPLVPEPIAREALSYVGADPEAEAVWTAAINDPSLAPDDRKNLIEDLNENGFADPDHPTMDELPLIEYRIQLLEQLAPDAMDETNSAAFQEAYKDLWEMHDGLVAK